MPAGRVAGVVADAAGSEAMAGAANRQVADIHVHPGFEGVVSGRDVHDGAWFGGLAGLLGLHIGDDAVDDDPDVVVGGG
jgi:hypothetical protein